MIKENHILSLINKGWFSEDSFLDHELCAALLRELRASVLRPAKVGRAQNAQLHTDIRTDSIYWLDIGLSTAQDTYIEKMHELMELLNREIYLGLKQFEGHFAQYNQAGFYRKHIDQFEQNSERKISVITYLNTPKAGGELRIYKKSDPNQFEIDISPVEGRLVCFLSNQIYHEVRPTHEDRYSIAGWLRTTLL
jgi:SM-20-related protein